jgi:hypothetical protein
MEPSYTRTIPRVINITTPYHAISNSSGILGDERQLPRNAELASGRPAETALGTTGIRINNPN